jgi:hypothetical protein
MVTEKETAFPMLKPEELAALAAPRVAAVLPFFV